LVFSSSHHPATTEIYTLSLHDALPIYLGPFDRTGQQVGHSPRLGDVPALRSVVESGARIFSLGRQVAGGGGDAGDLLGCCCEGRSEEHTSELQSRENLVCRLLLEKKKT